MLGWVVSVYRTDWNDNARMVHYVKNGGPEKEFLGDFDTFSAALINLNENAALKRFGRRFKTTPNNKFVEIGPFLKNEDGEECLLMDE